MAKLREIWEGKNCILCGGSVPAEGIEHAPPKSMFHDKIRPQGYEFPACMRCNRGTGHDDALVSFFSLIGRDAAILGDAKSTAHEMRLMMTVKRNFEGIRRSGKNVLISSPAGVITRRVVEAKLPVSMVDAFAKWCAKQAYAYFYKQTGKILGEEASVAIRTMTNATHSDLDDRVANLLGKTYSMSKAKQCFGDQFFYRFLRVGNKDCSFMQSVYHENAGFFAVIDESGSNSSITRRLPYTFKTSKARGIHQVSPKRRSILLFGSKLPR